MCESHVTCALVDRDGFGTSTNVSELYSSLEVHQNHRVCVAIELDQADYVIPVGDPGAFGTTSYWIVQYAIHAHALNPECFRLGSTLREEVVACVVGGYGVSAEVGLASFQHLRSKGLLMQGAKPTESEIEAALSAIPRANGGTCKHRFANQRAQRVEAVLNIWDAVGEPPSAPQELRRWLLALPGVGPKTAAWITRNWTTGSEVGILDVHVVRAGRWAGWFPKDWRVERHYDRMENTYLGVCRALRMCPAKLDAIIWEQMRTAGGAVVHSPGTEHATRSSSVMLQSDREPGGSHVGERLIGRRRIGTTHEM